jgi:CubicO group peptidase (beta-lactamase class C family)
MSPRRAIVAAALALFAGTGQAQTFSDTGPDAEGYGAKDGYPVPIGIPGALREQRYLVGRHSNYERLVRTRAVPRAAAVWHFKRAAEPLALDYRAPGGERSIAAYLAIHPTTGLLIVKGDTILFEHYQYARTDRDRFLSNSMAKTVIALLVGIALEEGRIRSIDDPVEAYVPGLRGKEYGGTTLRALLHMSSGVAFREEYDGTDDISRMAQGLARVAAGGQAAVIGQFDRRVAPPLTRFKYASIETEILGLVLAAALDRPVAAYLGEKIWQRIGAEADASWGLDGGGQELAFCCLNAVLRDYGRLGRLLAHDGAWDGVQIVPRQWVLDATTAPADKPFLAPAPGRYGYGYQVWLVPPPAGEAGRRMFVLLGVHGQAIFVDPASKLVMVQTAVRRKPTNDPVAAETAALWRALVAKLGTP